jgi:hypothetical protein
MGHNGLSLLIVSAHWSARFTTSLQKQLVEIVERAAEERKLKEDEKVLEKVSNLPLPAPQFIKY